MAQYSFREMLLTPGRGGRPGRKIVPKALVIHWTANISPGADAIANRNYFENHPQNKVSAHYIVDDNQVVQCIPENEMAYHVGASRYTEKALRELSIYPNNCTIGIEMCVNADGDFRKTYENTVALAADILWRYGWGEKQLWRHYDVTSKVCPAYFVDDTVARGFGFNVGAEAAWEDFKRNVILEMQKEGEKKVALEQWMIDEARKALAELNQRGLVNDPAKWGQEKELAKSIPAYLFWIMLARVIGSK